MLTLVAVFHILFALALVLFVLLQDPKGGAAGVFGGGGSGSTSLFGATGADNFLTTTTKWLAILFAVTCLLLTYLTSHRSTSVMDEFAPPAAVDPVTPGQAPLTPPDQPGQVEGATTAPAKAAPTEKPAQEANP